LRKFGALPTPSLEWNAEVERDTAHLYERIKNVVPSVEWPFFAPYVRAINAVKKERNAVILAHNYQTPEIYHCVADFVGDSLQLAREATKVKADVIVQAGVHFMAETAKILNPDKTVLIPDVRAGCSLASAITGEDVRLLRERFPGVPVVTYVNTSAEVKAESDITCTSSNALQVVESLGVDKVIFVPDQYLAKYVASQTKVKIIAWKGSCEVHERFTGDELAMVRANDPSVQIVAHPECPPDVIAASDFTGSTAHMIDFVRKRRPRRVVMVTECSMADNVRVEVPDVEFTQPCNLCPHMKRITLPKILDSLLTMQDEVVVDAHVAEKARRAIEHMIHLKA
jgi:quinolinate synthase